MENKEVKEALDFLYDEAATEYEIDEDSGELLYYDCTNQDKYLDPTNKIKDYIEQLEQAICKACEELEEFNMTYENGDYADIKNRYEWKEWCKENAE